MRDENENVNAINGGKDLSSFFRIAFDIGYEKHTDGKASTLRTFVQTKGGEIIHPCANREEETKLNHRPREYRVESAGPGESYGYQEGDDKRFKEH